MIFVEMGNNFLNKFSTHFDKHFVYKRSFEKLEENFWKTPRNFKDTSGKLRSKLKIFGAISGKL